MNTLSKRGIRVALPAILTVVAMIIFLGCAKYKTVQENTTLVANPGEKKAVLVENGQVARGEFVKLVEEKQFDGKRFFNVQLEGVDTKGWLEAKYLLDGKIQSMTVIKDADVFARPTLKGTKSGNVKAGQVVFKLKDVESFYQISFAGKEGFVEKANIGNASDVVRTVSIPGIGTAKVRASSYLITASGNELKYDPRNLFDGKINTGWFEGKANDDGIGEWVSVEFDTYVNLFSIGVVNGFAASEALYKANNRVAGLRVESDSGQNFDLDFSDENYEVQESEISSSGRSFKFIITRVHKGKVSDTGMSMIRLKGSVGSEYYGGGQE